MSILPYKVLCNAAICVFRISLLKLALSKVLDPDIEMKGKSGAALIWKADLFWPWWAYLRLGATKSHQGNWPIILIVPTKTNLIKSIFISFHVLVVNGQTFDIWFDSIRPFVINNIHTNQSYYTLLLSHLLTCLLIISIKALDLMYLQYNSINTQNNRFHCKHLWQMLKCGKSDMKVFKLLWAWTILYRNDQFVNHKMYYVRSLYLKNCKDVMWMWVDKYTNNHFAYVFRISMVMDCQMLLEKFPLDNQTCKINIGSCKYY